MSQAALLTWHGTLLCADRDGRLVQRPIGQADGVVTLRMPGPPDGFTRFLAGIGAGFPDCAGPLAGHVARPAGRGVVTLERDGDFLSAHPDRLTVETRRAAGPDGRFLAIPPRDLRHLRTILANDWLLRAECRLVRRADIAVEDGHALRLGPLRLDIADLLPFDGDTMPSRFTVHHDGWRVDQARLYRPLVYLTAYRDPAVFAQLRVALESLVRIGGYAGTVLLLTDDRSAAGEALATVDPARAVVRHTPAADRLGYIAARYAILDWPEAMHYQPVFYCDTDIVFDTPVDRMLHAVAACDRIAVPAEPFSPLGRAGSVGADLLAADGAEPRYAIGFNAGTLGIPSLAAHGDVLRLIRRIVANRAALHGRRQYGFLDQPVANYVAFRTGAFDTAALAGFVRYGWPGIATEPAARRGLVHFFPPRGARAKYEAMRDYLAALGPDAAAAA